MMEHSDPCHLSFHSMGSHPALSWINEKIDKKNQSKAHLRKT